MSFLLYLKFSKILEQQESQLIYISLYIIVEYSHSNHLIQISALYGFWLPRYNLFRRYTPPFSAIFLLYFKFSSIFEQHESLNIYVSYFVVVIAIIRYQFQLSMAFGC